MKKITYGLKLPRLAVIIGGLFTILQPPGNVIFEGRFEIEPIILIQAVMFPIIIKRSVTIVISLMICLLVVRYPPVFFSEIHGRRDKKLFARYG